MYFNYPTPTGMAEARGRGDVRPLRFCQNTLLLAHSDFKTLRHPCATYVRSRHQRKYFLLCLYNIRKSKYNIRKSKKMNYESIYPFMCTCVLVTNAVINEIYQKTLVFRSKKLCELFVIRVENLYGNNFWLV